MISQAATLNLVFISELETEGYSVSYHFIWEPLVHISKNPDHSHGILGLELYSFAGILEGHLFSLID